MLEHAPNLGDFMDRDERSVIAKILEEKVALQPLDDSKERMWTVRASPLCCCVLMIDCAAILAFLGSDLILVPFM